jgi:vacuolar protein-sorting-associated protein 4
VQTQGVGNNNDGVLLLGATNVPWELDQAMRRRFEKRIYIPLPEVQARVGLFKNRLGDTPNNLSEDDFLELGKGTDGYSGADIGIIVKEAMMMPVRRCQTATHFKTMPDGMMVPTFPSDPAGVQLTLMQVDPAKLKAPDVTTDDFFAALARIKPSVGEEDLVAQVKFTEDFGQDG